MMRHPVYTAILIITLLFSGSTLPAQMDAESNSAVEWITAVSWESLYVTEGINNLPGSSVFTVDLIGGHESMLFGIWAARGVSESYNEIEFFGAYGFTT